jgi:hypothetical protein
MNWTLENFAVILNVQEVLYPNLSSKCFVEVNSVMHCEILLFSQLRTKYLTRLVREIPGH